MDLGNSREQTATEILMDCQTELKILIRDAMYSVLLMAKFEQEKRKIIDNALEQIKNEQLREKARIALNDFANKEYKTMVSMLNLGNMPLVVAFAGRDMLKAIDLKSSQKELNKALNGLGKVELNKAFTNLGNSQAKVSYSHSLYGYAEMTARYEEQQKMVNNLKEKTNLVICDTHSDCSDRCFRWQGRVYSLDGTSGTTSDGRKYVPLDVAVKNTDYGVNNGLLGFNCRHKLVAYKDGLKPVKVSKQEQQREKKISDHQRLLEREIRTMKDMAQSFKNVDANKVKFYTERAKTLTSEYIQFCRDNNRVEYRSRLQI